MFPTHSTKFLLINDDEEIVDGIFMQVLRIDETRGAGQMAYVNENQNKYESFAFCMNSDDECLVTSRRNKVEIRALRDDDGAVMVFQMTNKRTGKSWYFLRENAEYNQEITEAVPEYNCAIAEVSC